MGATSTPLQMRPIPTEDVVYFLGAGFSAPLGLPVIANFIQSAKDQFTTDRGRFAHFEEIFKTIDRLAKIKNFFHTDLRNVEEILSILEVDDFVSDGASAAEFQRFLIDVVEYHTPQPMEVTPRPAGPGRVWAFGGDANVNAYANFVCALLNLVVRVSGTTQTTVTHGARPVRYSIVTTNYDRVLESHASFISERFDIDQPAAFLGVDGERHSPFAGTLLCKLHGSVDRGYVVPPTWSKGARPKVVKHWDLARSAIANANYIRFIGYSLAPSDLPVRYLLKNAILESENLKRIDVLCHDPTGGVKHAFEDFIESSIWRFREMRTESYLRNITQKCHDQRTTDSAAAILEDVHRDAFGE
jgi:hypothetical protein